MKLDIEGEKQVKKRFIYLFIFKKIIIILKIKKEYFEGKVR